MWCSLCAARCLLFVDCRCLLSVVGLLVRCLLVAVSCVSCAVRCLLFVAAWLLCVVCRGLCYLLFCCRLYVVRCSLMVACCLLCVVCWFVGLLHC